MKTQTETQAVCECCKFHKESYAITNDLQIIEVMGCEKYDIVFNKIGKDGLVEINQDTYDIAQMICNPNRTKTAIKKEKRACTRCKYADIETNKCTKLVEIDSSLKQKITGRNSTALSRMCKFYKEVK